MSTGVIASIRDRLLKEREALLDLSARNRLLNTPLRTRNIRTIEIVDEKSTEVFRLLSEGKSMTFLPGIQLSDGEHAELQADDNETGGIPQPDENETVDDRGIATRHSDTKLQTRLTSEGLQKRLFDIWYDARTLEEEQGVNILYLALGLLRWFDSETSEIVRHAPIVLMPIMLERSSAADRFHLKTRGESPSPNLTLQAKMKAEFGIIIDDFADEDAVDISAYMASVAQTVSKQKRWEVLPDAMVLGFFSFAKFLMYRDLDPDNWPESAAIGDHPLISALLRDGFPESPPLIGDDVSVDVAVPPLERNHVVDADSSQAVVIAEAANGRTLVVKGPPGTGKSQTITNIIAAAAAKGRKVLFVAEKMAALEVVYRRLQHAGLGPLALELHSNKINKRTVLEELRRTKEAAQKHPRGDISVIQKLGETGGQLNAFADRLHLSLRPCGLTPYQVMGRLVRAQQLGGTPGYELIGADSWTPSEYKERETIVAELAERLRELGPPPAHAWRGVRRDAVDPSEQDTLLRQIGMLRDALASAMEASEAANRILGAPHATSLGNLESSLAYLKAAQDIPTVIDRSALRCAEWRQDVHRLQRLVAVGEDYSKKRQRIDALATPTAWTADFAAIRRSIARKGSKVFRFLSGEYRSQLALLRSYLKSPLPKKVADRLALIDEITEAQETKRAFESVEVLGKAFGRLWVFDRSDWKELAQVLAWRIAHGHLPDSTWPALADANIDELTEAASRLNISLSEVRQNLGSLIEFLDLDLRYAFKADYVEQILLDDLSGALERWAQEIETLSRFIAFATRGRVLEGLGAASLVKGIHDGRLDPVTIGLAFERAWCETLRRSMFRAWPELRAFDGQSHDRLVQAFRQLDRARISLAREQIASMHSEQRPRANGGVGPLGVLNAELAKRRAHLPIRQLLDKAGPAIQQLKPVFMMSPLSVAQFLKPGGLRFDVLVIDEASQIEPVDALGAIARVEQLVVVGDQRQLPPTSFFKKLTGEEDIDEDELDVALQAKDAESILDLCLAKGVPDRMLCWHYRSKHQSLIAVSNKEFYDNKLFIVPSPYDAIAGMGLHFHLLKDAPYDRGGTRTNPAEARIVAQAVMRHAIETPDQSLGVATFSVAQRQMVLKELELLRRAHPETEDFFGANASEPFVVKNLENIQGDERDVIFISVGYGKTEEGYLAHAFGPLSAEGGERRLNVLISRAKLRCEVFCNFTGADIDLERTRSRGVAALKLFLTFAETGKFGLGEITGGDHDSEFEAQVCDKLRALGYNVKAQIGASGFRVDLAIADPEKPGRFVLGIECDGVQYHSSRSARDRDRLRQQVLEAHGWIIHRIWSADWYLRPQEELKKVETAIAAARAEWRERDERSVVNPKAVPIAFETGVHDDDTVIGGGVHEPSSSFEHERVLYKEASFAVNRSVEPHQAQLADMAAYVVKIVQIEGPIHLDEISVRIRALWGLQRAGSRIRSAVERAAGVAAQRGLIAGEEFFIVPGSPIAVRDRSQVASPTLRKPEMLPPKEIECGLLKVVGENFGATREELVHAVSRLFGYASTSAQLKAVIDASIDRLLRAGQLETRGDLLVEVAHRDA